MKSADERLRVALHAILVILFASFVAVYGAADLKASILGAGFAGIVLAAPWLVSRLASKAESTGLPATLVGLVHVVGQALPLAVAGATRASVALMALLLLLGANLVHRRASDRAASGAVVIAPVVVSVGFAVAPGVVWLALYPAALAVGIVAAIALQARRAERRGAKPAGGSPWLYALPLTALLMVAGFAVHLAVHVAPAPLFRLSADGDKTVETTDPAEAEPSEATRDAQDTFEQIFPDGLDHGRGVTQLSRETVMNVRPADGRDHGQVYLRGMVLDVLTARGATFRGRRGPRFDAGPDGWIDLQREVGGGATLELEIEQQPIKIRDGEQGILFAPARLLAIERDAVEHDPDGLLIAPRPEEDWFRFRCVSQERRAGTLPLGDQVARHPDPLYRELPDTFRDGAGSRALVELDRTARDVVAGARSDVERVVRIVRWFQTEFTYDLEASEFPGLDGVLQFVEERRGPCTWFASASTLMLRCLDVPTRIATGFVGKDFDEEAGVYVVTSNEGHAWIEVYFEGIGWVTFDPTPSRQRADALAAALADYADAGFQAWAGDLASRIGDWARSGGEIDRMREVLASLADGPRAAWRGLAARLGATGAVLVLVLLGGGLLVLLTGLVRRPRAGAAAAGGAPTTQVDARAATLRARLIALLARLGFERRPPVTLRELTLAATAGPQLGAGDRPARLLALADALDRARFGGLPLTADEERRAEAVLADLAAWGDPDNS